MADEVTLDGIVKRVVFRNNTGFSVFTVNVEGKDTLTVSGVTNAREGDSISIEGRWVTHPSYGKQIKATSVIVALPQKIDGMVKYLGSGILPGVGDKIAARIVERFGDNTFEVMDNDIDRLSEVQGISEKKLAVIRDNWQRENGVRRIMVFLQGHGITAALANRIYKAYCAIGIGKDDPGKIIQNIKEYPWNLARNVSGVGFLTADRIALSMGKSETEPARLMAALAYCLEESAGMGNCGMDSVDLIMKTSKMLGVDPELLRAAHKEEALREDAAFVIENGITWLAQLYKMETRIAEMLINLTAGTPSWGHIDTEKAIAWAENQIGNKLADQQRQALRMALSSKVSVITGGPGCGKTFLLNAILKVMEKKGVSMLLAAPTGRAACRMEEATGRESATLHRRLGLGGRHPVEKLDCDLLVTDEGSMNDVSLFFQTLRRLPAHASLLIVGDADQLPSVGPGSVLNDIINSGAVPVVRLDKVFRQAEGSRIIQAAHRINKGLMPDLTGDPASDFLFIEEDNLEKIPGIIEDLVARRLPQEYGFDPVNDIQVLSPMKKSPSGTGALNNLIQAAVNPNPSEQYVSFGTRFGVGDKVMQTANNYDKGVFNGDSGVIKAIDKEEGTMTVRFKDGNVEYPLNDLDELVLASAITVHKSQGADFAAVVMPVSTQHYIMLQRNLIYTGVTRARQLCVIVGQKKALATAIGNGQAAKRITRLGRLLRDSLDSKAEDVLRHIASPALRCRCF